MAAKATRTPQCIAQIKEAIKSNFSLPLMSLLICVKYQLHYNNSLHVPPYYVNYPASVPKVHPNGPSLVADTDPISPNDTDP